MSEPVFLSLDEVLEGHRRLLEKYGGAGGVRDVGLLQSAVAMPQAGFAGQYFHQDLFEMGAAYPFHIVQKRPFVDGNKRAGLHAVLVFLEINGVEIEAPDNGMVHLVLKTAIGKRTKAQIAEFFRKHSRRR